eukprot:4453955-Pyramimonas_sp.AAC.2
MTDKCGVYQHDLSFPRGQRPYLLTLRSDIPNPLLPELRPVGDDDEDEDEDDEEDESEEEDDDDASGSDEESEESDAQTR